jgi:hypothetical protein
MRGVPLFQKGFWDENMTLPSSGASQNPMKYVSSQINILHSRELCVSFVLRNLFQMVAMKAVSLLYKVTIHTTI